jgi:hypothetical protein
MYTSTVEEWLHMVTEARAGVAATMIAAFVVSATWPVVKVVRVTVVTGVSADA